MVGKRYSLEEISHLKDRGVFFDANILMYLFWSSNPEFEKTYATFYTKLLQKKNKFYVDVLVISEIVNSALRIEHKKYNALNKKKPIENFKQYRNSKSGKDSLFDIYTTIELRIIKNFEIVGKLFNKSELSDLLVVDNLDFNDKAIAKICQDNQLVLLTNDSDFAKADIEILTANKKLLT